MPCTHAVLCAYILAYTKHICSDRDRDTNTCRYHLIATYDGTTMRLYTNGVLASLSNVQFGAIQYPDQATFAIGAYVDKPNIYPLQGALDDVALWDRAVAAHAVAAMYAAHRDELYFCCPSTCPLGKVPSGACVGDVRVDCVQAYPCPHCSQGTYLRFLCLLFLEFSIVAGGSRTFHSLFNTILLEQITLQHARNFTCMHIQAFHTYNTQASVCQHRAQNKAPSSRSHVSAARHPAATANAYSHLRGATARGRRTSHASTARKHAVSTSIYKVDVMGMGVTILFVRRASRALSGSTSRRRAMPRQVEMIAR
jgi:hypothetical protein